LCVVSMVISFVFGIAASTGRWSRAAIISWEAQGSLNGLSSDIDYILIYPAKFIKNPSLSW